MRGKKHQDGRKHAWDTSKGINKDETENNKTS